METDTKKDIRKRVLARRASMTEEEWQQKSQCIFEKVTEHLFFVNAEVIYCYVDYRREVDTHRLLQKAWELGKKTAVPKVIGTELEFYLIEKWEDLEAGYCGILEPTAACPRVSPKSESEESETSLIILPGAAFDQARHRIGYGKGFYDRYLSRHGNCRTIALAFDFQVEASIPTETQDIRPQVIVTEERLYV